MTGELVVGRSGRSGATLLHRFTAPQRRVAFWVLLWAAAAAAELGALVPLFSGTEPVDPIEVVLRLVGGSFAACGLIAWHGRPDNHSGRLMTATGFAFLVAPLLGQLDSPLAKTAGLVLSDLWVLFFVPLLLTFLTGGRVRSVVDRVLVAGVLLELVVLSPLWLVFAVDEPSLLLLVPDVRVAHVVDAVQRGLYLVISVATAVVVAVRWRAATRPGRRALLPGVAGATCLLLFGALLAVDLVASSRSQPLLWVTACSLITVPVAFLAGLLRSRLARGVLADLFRGLGTMRPAELQAALSRALGDPDFVIAYPLPGGHGHIDANGGPVTLPEPGGERSVAVVERAGEEVAVLVYDRSLDEDPELVDAVGGAATVALENRHLHAEAEARLAELAASRQRIVTAGDAERRRIERNLHDGAQQRLVTLALQLSLIRRRIRVDPSEAELLVRSASDELARSLDELRELARGIHPAVLDQGLAFALDALALRSAVPTTVSCELPHRLPEPVESTAYYVASEALANVAKHAGAGAVTVRVMGNGQHAVIEIADDGVGGADPSRGSGLRGLADRVEALGGVLRVACPPDGGTVVTAQLPYRR